MREYIYTNNKTALLSPSMVLHPRGAAHLAKKTTVSSVRQEKCTVNTYDNTTIKRAHQWSPVDKEPYGSTTGAYSRHTRNARVENIATYNITININITSSSISSQFGKH